MAIQPDGKIVLAGTTSWSQNAAASNNFALNGYNVNGSLDTTFGTGGKVTTDFGGRDMAKSIAIQTIAGQLKIVAAVCRKRYEQDFAGPWLGTTSTAPWTPPSAPAAR
ncbi:MAG: delta-60 repeat domain-containing protein [Gemmataceae bacterium]